MTWIKPSFFWMMYRCGWASKPGQERVLAIEVDRTGFDWALRHACLSHYDPVLYGDRESWVARRDSTPVRIQWDPERSPRLEALPDRSIQIGLGGEAAARYVTSWIVGITDVTELARSTEGLVMAGDLGGVAGIVPIENPYPLSDELAHLIGATPGQT